MSTIALIRLNAELVSFSNEEVKSIQIKSTQVKDHSANAKNNKRMLFIITLTRVEC